MQSEDHHIIPEKDTWVVYTTKPLVSFYVAARIPEICEFNNTPQRSLSLSVM